MHASTTTVPGYLVGTWTIDPLNSDVSFAVRHLGVSRVHGRFNELSGDIVTGATIDRSSVSARIVADSVDTGFPGRDGFIAGDDVLAAGEHRELTFVSTGVRTADGEYFVDGHLTVRGITRQVTFTVELGGFGANPDGRPVIGVSARTTVRRADFGFGRHVPAAVVSDGIDVRLDVQATLAG